MEDEITAYILRELGLALPPGYSDEQQQQYRAKALRGAPAHHHHRPVTVVLTAYRDAVWVWVQGPVSASARGRSPNAPDSPRSPRSGGREGGGGGESRGGETEFDPLRPHEVDISDVYDCAKLSLEDCARRQGLRPALRRAVGAAVDGEGDGRPGRIRRDGGGTPNGHDESARRCQWLVVWRRRGHEGGGTSVRRMFGDDD